MTAAGSIVKSNLLWSENWSRPNPAGWVSGRIRARTRIPYYQLCDINTCLPLLSSQPFINTAVAVKFSLFFFSGSTFTYFQVRQESFLPSPCSSSASSAPIKHQEHETPHVCQHKTKTAGKCFLGCPIPHTPWVQLLRLHFILCGILQPHMNI